MNLLNQKSKGNQLPNNIQQLLNGIKSGTINPKQTSLDFLSKATPQQKQALKQLIPQMTKLGKTLGISENQIQQFTNELNSKL